MPDPAEDQQVGGTEEQSPEAGDQAGSGDSGVEEQSTTENGDTGEESTPEEAVELLGKDQYDTLKGDPEKLIKELNKAATKKFQALSAERKQLEPYKAFIAAVEEDPVAAVTAVAKRLGIKLADDGNGNGSTEKIVKSLGDQITEAIRASMGPEYDDLSDRMAAGVHEALKLAIPELTKDTREQVGRVIDDSSARESQLILETFGKSHPDWKKYDEQMTALSKKYPPGEGVTEMEYLETLYHLATRDGKNGDGVKKAITKMTTSAKKANSDGTSVSGDIVSMKPGKPPTFAEAAAAARRGQRFE